MSGKLLVRLLGVAVCVGAFAVSNEAEAGRRHRRHAYDPCCEPVCCEPVCVTRCEPACCAPACETVAMYDSCGRLVYRRVACCETLVASPTVISAPSCCGIASTGSVDATIAAQTPASESAIATTASVVKEPSIPSSTVR